MAEGSRSGPGWAAWLQASQGMIFPLTVLGSLVIFVLPLPPWGMDLLLSLNIGLSVLVLLATVTLKSPMEFSAFPTVLLATTLFRLVLNVASTRLILVNAARDGELAAGHVIAAFGDFVARGNLVLGIIIFIILSLIQFMVINRGSTRTSEVAARFALDGMPGKQMAIDADLNAGIINEQEAKRRREEISAQADFYGSMDGASKFVRGDAIAGILITIVNIVGGLAVGSLYYNMPLARAAEVYTKLTIGDGLVSQIPAMLLSLAAGFLVTRQSAPVNLSRQLAGQLFFANPQTLDIAGAFIGILALSAPITGLPFFQLALVSASSLVGAYFLRQRRQVEEVRRSESERVKATQEARRPAEKIEDVLRLDPLELEVGYGLIPLADKRKGGDIEERIVLIRKRLANELGMILPGVRLRDNPNLEPNDYQIRLRGVPVAKGTAFPGHYLAIDTGMTSGKLQGIATIDPLFGQQAYWIDPNQRERAELMGYSVIEASHVVTTHLTETIKKYAADLLNRERVQSLINVVKEVSPQVVSEVTPELLKLGDIQRVLQNLLRENVSIRDLETILETLGDYAPKTKDVDVLTEYVRHRLSRSICQQYRDADGLLKVITLDPALEDMIAAGIEHTDRLTVKLSPAVMEGIGRAIAEEVKTLLSQNRPSVLLVGPQIRPAVRQMTAPMIPSLAVLSFNEITRDTKVEMVGVVNYQPQGRAAMAAAS